MIIAKKELLPLLKSLIPEARTIVEAGAFDGTDTKKLSELWPEAIIHAFEPVPEIFERLTANTQDIPTITRHPYALSNTNGDQLFYKAEHPKKPAQPCQAGSLLKPKERLSWSAITYPSTITVPTITLSSWMEKHAVTHIDLLWLDLQGNELPVLQAAIDKLPTIYALYTEVSFIDAYESQARYEEVRLWLEAQGYREYGRDFKDQTSWFFGNALFFQEKYRFDSVNCQKEKYKAY